MRHRRCRVTGFWLFLALQVVPSVLGASSAARGNWNQYRPRCILYDDCGSTPPSVHVMPSPSPMLRCAPVLLTAHTIETSIIALPPTSQVPTMPWSASWDLLSGDTKTEFSNERRKIAHKDTHIGLRRQIDCHRAGS
uniref:Putative secreted protein n=1 Tax=Anopheles triannulatus TaxID=58253 RepID=A0A2M4B6G7_9DIPT